MKNLDATCSNCAYYTRRGECKKALNTVIDYENNDNPYCWHWIRSFKSSLEKVFEKIKK